MKEVNEELEGNTPAWDSNLERWIEPDEVLENKTPEVHTKASRTDWTETVRRMCEEGDPRYEQRDIANLNKPEPTTDDPKSIGEKAYDLVMEACKRQKNADAFPWLPVPDAEQRDKQRDIGGNVIEDRIQANLDRYKDGPEHD